MVRHIRSRRSQQKRDAVVLEDKRQVAEAAAALAAPVSDDDGFDPNKVFEDAGDVMGEDLSVGFGGGGDGTEQPV